MGLDMYMSARKHIKKINWEDLNNKSDEGITDYAAATYPQFNDVVNAAGVATLVDKDSIYGVDVMINVAYWRKVNAVHNWFVQNVQGGEDNCGEYYVSNTKIRKLLETARQCLFEKNPNLLPPADGFFFGGTDIDEWYWYGLKDTIDQLQPLIDRPDFDKLSFYYQSSW